MQICMSISATVDVQSPPGRKPTPLKARLVETSFCKVQTCCLFLPPSGQAIRQKSDGLPRLWNHEGATYHNRVQGPGCSSRQYVWKQSKPEGGRGLKNAEWLEKALHGLSCMDQQGIVPSSRTYRSLLQACLAQKALVEAKYVLAHLANNGLESDQVLGEFAVSTLVKCGSLQDGLQLFRKLVQPTIRSWGAVIGGYSRAGEGRRALNMYQEMQEQGVEPDRHTLVSLLRACSSLGDLAEGKRVHAEAVKHRCDTDLYVGTALVDMYARCGSMVDARHVFDTLPERDVVSWNAMLAGYIQQEHMEMALELYSRMLKESVRPDDRTFVSVLKACASLAELAPTVAQYAQSFRAKCLQKGRAIHADATRGGYDSDVFVGTTLVSMYAKCGSLEEAERVFLRLSTHNVVLWNAMLAGFVQHDQGGKALDLYSKMQREQVIPDDRTFVSVLKACGNISTSELSTVVHGESIKVKSLERGKAIHRQVALRGFESDRFVGSALVSMYAKCGSVSLAQLIFDRLSQYDVVVCNAMLAGFVQQEQGEKALELYDQMQKGGVTPTDASFVSVLKAYSILAERDSGYSIRETMLEKGRAVHAEAIRAGYGSHLSVCSALLSMYSKCGCITDAQHLFDTLPERDVVAWNTILAGYVQLEDGLKVLQLYARMQEEGVSPNGWTFVNLFRACASLADMEEDTVENGDSFKAKSLEKGKVLHAISSSTGYELDMFVGNSLVIMYAKCGSMVDAEEVFGLLSNRNVVSWSAMIRGYAEKDQSAKALHLYSQMRVEGVHPDEATVVSVLKACGNAGALDTCIHVHREILQSGLALGLEQGLCVANSLIHAYGKCGSMVKAQAVFDSLPYPSVVSWNALIAGYARHAKVASSIQCFQDMQKAGLKPNGVTFLSLLSACSHAGLVDEGVKYFASMTKDHGVAPAIGHFVSLVDLFGRAGLLSRAATIFLRMPVQPSLSLWLSLLGACRKYGDIELGRRSFDFAVALEPKCSSAYVLMSNIYAQAGMLDSAAQIDEVRRRVGAWKQTGQSWIEHEGEVLKFKVGECQEGVYALLQHLQADRHFY